MNAAEFLAEFDQEMPGTRRALESIPTAALDFRPHERSWTLGELASHIANVPNWLTVTLESSEFDLAAPMEPEAAPQSAAEVVERFHRAAAGARAALEGTDEETLAGPWTLRSGAHVVFTLPRHAVLRSMIFNHMVHHRGQLTVYLRMVGARVPGLYGPSADEG